MWFRGLMETVQRSRHRAESTLPRPDPIAPPVAAAPSILDDFREARLVDRRGPSRPRDVAIDAPSRQQAEALEDVLKAIETMSAELGLDDSPRDIVITTRREFQILRFLEGDPATYLFARLGREGVALPEARLRVRDLELALGA